MVIFKHFLCFRLSPELLLCCQDSFVFPFFPESFCPSFSQNALLFRRLFHRPGDSFAWQANCRTVSLTPIHSDIL